MGLFSKAERDVTNDETRVRGIFGPSKPCADIFMLAWVADLPEDSGIQ